MGTVVVATMGVLGCTVVVGRTVEVSVQIEVADTDPRSAGFTIPVAISRGEQHEEVQVSSELSESGAR